MTALFVILCAAWLVLIVVGVLGHLWDTRPHVPGSQLAEVANRLYARLFHGLRVHGKQNIASALAMRGEGEHTRPLIVISNHKAGVDGLLVSAAVPFFIRWMMAADMKAPGLDAAYAFAGLIFVARETPSAPPSTSDGAIAPPAPPANRDLAGLREALRHVQSGAILGIFPEGRLCRHRGQIYPFAPGVGLLIAKSRAIVLPAVLREAPVCEHAYSSLIRPSRSVIEFMEPIDLFAPQPSGGPAVPIKAGAIAKHLEEQYVRWVGPVNYEPPRAAKS